MGGGRLRSARVPVSPQLAMRVAILGGVAIAMFAIIFFRLWFLQVLSGEQYVQQANANRVRDLPIAAPRGEILDREGQPLVASRTTNAVQIVPSALPPAGAPRLRLYRRLGRLLGMSGAHVQALVIKGRTAVPYAPVTIKTDAGRGALTVLAERQSEYPGVTQQPVSIRAYPYGEMAAQVLGYVGQVSETELKMRAFDGVKQGTVVGQEGLEYYYDRYLRGNPGIERVEVNAAGYPVPSKLAPTQPKAGYSLKVTLDMGLQARGRKGAARGHRKRARRRQTGGRGRVRRARPAQRAGARDRLLADVRPEQVRQTADEGRIRGARGQIEEQLGRRIAGAADRPRGQRHLSDGLDVQADHGDGHARSGRDQPERGARRGPVHLGLHRAVLQRRQGQLRRGRPRRSAEGLLRHLLLRSGRAGQQSRQRDPARGAQARRGRADRHRPAERDHRARPRPRVARESRQGGARMRAAQARLELRHLRRAPMERRRQHAPRRRAGRPA